jgi:hypothetical protein
MDVVVFAGESTDFVKLARTRSGRMFRKKILNFGPFKHPANPSKTVDVTPEFADRLVENFNAGYCPIVQATLVDEQNRHTEDPLRNIGEIVDVRKEKDGVYAYLDARKENVSGELGKTLLGASAMMHLDYTDTKTGKHVGPTLLHMAVTNRPYLTDLSGYEEVVAASAVSADTSTNELVLLSHTQEESMTLEEMIAKLKNEHGIDVAALQAQTNSDVVTALSNVLTSAGVIQLSDTGDEDVTSVITDAVLELSATNTMLSEQVAVLSAAHQADIKDKASREVRDLIRQGRILPVQEAAMLELRLSNVELFNSIVPNDSIVGLSEVGVTTSEETTQSAEVDRYTNMAR